MRGTIKVIICSFLDLWFSNSILPSGKSKKPSCLLVMRWTISILPEFLENYLWFSWFLIFIIIITWEKQEGQSDGGSPATLHVFNHYVLPDDHWCLLSFVVCVFDFPYHRMEESGRSKWGKTKGFALQPLSVGSSAVDATIYICSLWPGKIRDASTGPLVSSQIFASGCKLHDQEYTENIIL